ARASTRYKRAKAAIRRSAERRFRGTSKSASIALISGRLERFVQVHLNSGRPNNALLSVKIGHRFKHTDGQTGISVEPNWLSVAARSAQSAKIPTPQRLRLRLNNMGGFHSCRAAVIVLGDDKTIRDKLLSLLWRDLRENPCTGACHVTSSR